MLILNWTNLGFAENSGKHLHTAEYMELSRHSTNFYLDNKSLSPISVQFSPSVMSDSAIPWTAARQASLSTTNSRGLLNLMSI